MFKNKKEIYSIRKTKLAVASVLTGLLLAGPVLSNVPVLNTVSQIAYAAEVNNEVPLSKYVITANVDTKNELQEGSNATSKTHTSNVKIVIPDTTEIKSGDYISFTVDGMNFQENNFVMVNGIHVGKLVRISYTDASALASSNDITAVSKIKDGFSSSNEDAEFRIIFNDNIETLANATLEVVNTGSQTYALADHAHEEIMSIKDSSGKILSSKRFLIPASNRKDVTTPYTDKSINEFRTSTTTHSLSTRKTTGNFVVSLIDETGERDKYKAGTVITFNYVDNPYLKPLLNSLLVKGEPITKGSIVDETNIGSPNIVIGSGQTNPNGYFYGTNNRFKYEVLELDENTFSIKLLEDLFNVGQNYYYFATFEYNLSEISENSIDKATGELKIPPTWNVSITNAEGRSNQFDWTANMQYIGSFASIDGEGLSTPKFKVNLNIVDENGNLLKENVTSTQYLVEGSSYTLTGPDSITVKNETYYPKAGKTITKQLNRNELTVNLVYSKPTSVDFTSTFTPNPELPAGEKKKIKDGVPGTSRPDGTVITPPIPEEYEVGTKPTEKTIPFKKETVEDPTKPLTYREITTPGEVGIETTTYTVDPKTGEVTPKVEITKQPVTEITTVGVGANKPIPKGIVYEADPNDTADNRVTVDEGKDGLANAVDEIIENPKPTVIKVGTKTEIEKTPIPFDISYIESPELEAGVKETLIEGENGEIIKTTTYTLNTSNGQLDSDENIEIAEPTVKVIKVGTKPKVVSIPYKTKTIEDPEKPLGYREVVTKGENGEETTTYTLNQETGEVSTNPVAITKEVKDEVIVIGVGKETPIPKGTVYIKDPTKPVGEPNTTTTPGKDGVRNPDGTVKEEPVNEVVSVPASDKVEREVLPFKTIYIENKELTGGTTVIKTPGKDGEVVTTTSYTVNDKGEVRPNEPVSERTEAIDKVVEIGTKPLVVTTPFDIEIIEDPNKPEGYDEIEVEGENGNITTTYTFNPETGEITSDSVVTEPKNAVRVLGVGANIPIPAGVVYEADPELPFGETSTTPGKDGLKDVTGKIIEEPTPTIVKIGTKVEDKVIPFDKTTVYDPELPDNETKITTVGVPGLIKTTVTVDKETGKTTVTEDVTPAVTEVTTIGRKPIYTEEWIGDPFAGDGNDDAEVIVSNDVIYDQEWIDDPYVTDHPEINNYTIVVNVDGIQGQVSNFDGITDEEFMKHLESARGEMEKDPRKLLDNGMDTNGNTITLNYKSPDEYKEEWIGDPFVGDKDKDAEHIVSVDKIIEDLKEEEPMPEKPKEEIPVKEVPKVETPKAETPKAEGVKKEEKKLPNTGTDDSSSMLAASAGASLIGFAALAYRRKRK